MSTIACDDGSNDNVIDIGGSGHLGETLLFSEQVILWLSDDITSKQQYTGNRTINSNIGVNRIITDGKLNFSVGTPYSDSLRNISDLWFGVIVSNPSTQYAVLEYLPPDDWFFSVILTRHGETYSGNDSIGSYTEYRIDHIYVDQDVNIIKDSRIDFGGPMGYDLGHVFDNAFNLNLIKGWNAVLYKTVQNWPKQIDVGVIKFYTLLDNRSHLSWVLWDGDIYMGSFTDE